MITFEKIFTALTLLLFLLCIFYPLKRTAFVKNHPRTGAVLKLHNLWGILILAAALSHGILAGKGPAMISGKLAWTALLLLAVTAPLKKKMQAANWRRLHIILAAASTLLVVLHAAHAFVSRAV